MENLGTVVVGIGFAIVGGLFIRASSAGRPGPVASWLGGSAERFSTSWQRVGGWLLVGLGVLIAIAAIVRAMSG